MQVTKTFDERIWYEFRAGDKKAFAVIYRHYYPRLYNYGRKFTGDTALIEDCSQEIFTAFWHNRSKLENVNVLHSYLFVSFRNCLLKALQKNNSTDPLIPDQDFPFQSEITIDQLMINEEKIYEHRIHLDKALQLLTERQKEAIFLKYYENMSYDETSHILGISAKGTYKLVARAIAVLRTTYRQNLSSTR